MNQAAFAQIEAYMKDCMRDSAHDREHVYRVLYFAMDIAKNESGVNRDVLIAACLLHDTGRAEQLQNPRLRHEQVGSRKALAFLLAMGWPEADAAHAAECIATHRFRSDNPPKSLEAKILFDADKLDAVGAMGIARTLQYKGTVSQPLYTLDAQGRVSDGDGDALPSFFQEYKYKLEKLYGRFYTPRGAELAGGQRQAAAVFYDSLLSQVRACYDNGKQTLDEWVEQAEEPGSGAPRRRHGMAGFGGRARPLWLKGRRGRKNCS